MPIQPAFGGETKTRVMKKAKHAASRGMMVFLQRIRQIC